MIRNVTTGKIRDQAIDHGFRWLEGMKDTFDFIDGRWGADIPVYGGLT